MGVQKIRCPKCKKEFTTELPDSPGKFMISCPGCNFKSNVNIKPSKMPSAVMSTPEEKEVAEKGSELPGGAPPRPESEPLPEKRDLPPPPPPPEQAFQEVPQTPPPPPPPSEPKVVTMKPLSRKQREKDMARRKKAERKAMRRQAKGRPVKGGKDVVVGKVLQVPTPPPPPRRGPPPKGRGAPPVKRAPGPPEPEIPEGPTRFTTRMRIDGGRVLFDASGPKVSLTGSERSPEIVVFRAKDEDHLKLEVIDPNVAVFRILTPTDGLLAFMYEKLSGDTRTIFLQFSDGKLLSMKGDMTTGPGGYAFDLSAVNDAGEELGRCFGEGRAFQGSGTFVGEFADPRIPIGTLAALHLMGNTAKSHQ